MEKLDIQYIRIWPGNVYDEHLVNQSLALMQGGCDAYIAVTSSGLVAGEIAFSKVLDKRYTGITSLEVYCFRDQGIASHLIELVEKESIRDGIYTVATNSTNNSFWEHMEYKISKRRQRVACAEKEMRT